MKTLLPGDIVQTTDLGFGYIDQTAHSPPDEPSYSIERIAWLTPHTKKMAWFHETEILRVVAYGPLHYQAMLLERAKDPNWNATPPPES